MLCLSAASENKTVLGQCVVFVVIREKEGVVLCIYFEAMHRQLQLDMHYTHHTTLCHCRGKNIMLSHLCTGEVVPIVTLSLSHRVVVVSYKYILGQRCCVLLLIREMAIRQDRRIRRYRL